MPTAPSARAEWLKQRELSVSSTDAAIVARWGEDAPESTQSSLLVEPAAATAELARQMALLGTVRGRDLVTLEGVHFDLEGETIDIDYAGQMGIAGMARMLVLRTRVDLNANATEVEGEVQL